jgi:dTDP-4-amino-4,6-dideoxygalactose transaminase
MRGKFLPFHLPSIGKEEIKNVNDVLRSGWITTGLKTKLFEEKFAKYIGSKHALAVNSCTAALHLALEAIGLKEGDEVILPTMTFTATGEVVTYFKAKPVLIDCEEETLLIDINKIEEKINKKTKAIMPVHYAGQSCDMDEILQLARSHNLKVIEDAAHSLPAKYKGKTIGNIGDITCFSFYATKTITTGEGGMITTESDYYLDRMKTMRLHGITKDAWKRYAAEGAWYYEVIEAGFKYNFTDIGAALGLAQLEKCDEFHKKREKIANQYTKAFETIPEIKIPGIKKNRNHAWHLYVIQLNLERLKINRAQFIKKMKERNIGCSVHFIPLHFHRYYRNTYGYKLSEYPTANHLYPRIVSLPIYPRMTDKDVDYVINNVVHIIKENKL